MKKLTQAIFAAFMMTSLMVKADPPGTIVDIAAANSNFTTLVTALQVTGLDAALQEPGPFTVFAPTDAAFAALPPGVLDALLATPDQLAQVLLYHVASGAVLSGDLAEGPLVMLQGAAAAITLSGGAKIDGVSIVTTDIIASNGVIHVIDEVLLPPGNIVEIAAANPNFSTLVAAVVAAGLADTLANDGPFTVFAPTDAAFAALPPGVLDDLLADTAKLQQVLLYHVLSGRVRSTDLVDGPVTTLQGAPATIAVAGPTIDGVSIIAADIEALNGVIHVIDEVLLPPNIVEIAIANTNFSTLVTAVVAAGLADTLANDGPFTVFAPTDAAFAALPPGVLDDLLADPDYLRQVLLYHVVPGRVLSTDLVDGKVATAQGAAALIDVAGPTIDGVSIIAADIQALNGVIHVIDEVLLPPGNIVEIAAANPNFSTLVTAVVAAGLADTLANDGPFTVFAPTDAAFAALPPGVLDDLLADTAKLQQVLLYHVLSGRVRSTDLVDGPVTTLQGAPATIAVAGPTIDGVSIIAADIEALNGVIHVIDEVLLPPNIVEIAIANTNFSTLVTAVVAAGLADTLANDGPFTVFAPTDAAFAALPPGVLDDLLADPDYLRQVLLYHVVPGRVLSTDLVDGKVATAQGAAALIDVAGPTIDGVSIIAADIQALNGVIHVIDEVLLPPPNIVQIAAANPNFSTLVAAITAAGLVDVLQEPGPFTVFAPTDAAFAALPPGVLDALLDDPDRLRHLLLYHVAHGRLRAGDLSTGPLPTALGAPIQLNFDGVDPLANTAVIIQTDIEALNGIIHVLDAIVFPLDGFLDSEVSANLKDGVLTLAWPAVLEGRNAVLESTQNLLSGIWTPIEDGIGSSEGIEKATLTLDQPFGIFRIRYQD